jgi:hypothetical protein
LRRSCMHAFESDRARPRCRRCQAQSSRDLTARAGVDVLLAQLRIVVAHARVARSRLERAASDLKRDGGGDRRVPDPRRLPRFAATIEQDLIVARGPWETATSSRNPPPPSSPCCGASRPASPDARSTRGSALAEYRQDPHPRAVPQPGRNVASGRGRAPARAPPARSQRITRVILGPHGPNRGHGQAC